MPAANVALRRITWMLFGLAVLFVIVWHAPALYTVQGLASYLPLHMFAETFSIVVSMLVFGVAWNVYSKERTSNIVILACALLAVGLIDFAHMLSYKGMPDFITPSDPEKAINLWLSARLLAALALLVVALRPWQLSHSPRKHYGLLAVSLIVAGVMIWLGLAYPQAWPHTFIEGEGLTPLKIGAEYAIIAILLIPAIRFYFQARRPQSYDAASLFAATVITILSELCFTVYSDVADIFNLLGHLYKILAYIFIYRAVFVSSVREPFQRLDKELSENRRITQQLLDSAAERTQLAAIVEFSNDAIIGKTPDGIITSWNIGAERIYGYSAEEIVGKHITTLALPEQHAEMRQLLEKVRNGEVVLNYEAERVRKDGAHIYVSLTLSPIRDTSGQLSGISTIAHDITERKRIQQDIIAREIDFRTLVENSADPILRYDRDCRRVYVNPEIHRISGKPIESLIGHKPSDGQLLSDSEAEKLTTAIHRTFDNDQACHTDFEFIDLNGDLHSYDMLLIPEHDADGKVKTVLGIARDITERRQAEQELHRLNRELQAISNCNQSLLMATDEQELLNEICNIICKQAGYLFAWVGYAENDVAKTIKPVAWAGVGGDYIANTKLSWSGAEHDQVPAGIVIRSGEPIYVENFEDSALMTPWKQNALEHGYHSGIALPLKNENGQPFGALLIYSGEKKSFNLAEIRLLEELAADMAYGITNLRARAERQRVTEALQASEHLQRLLLDSLTQQVFYKDLDSRYIACNLTFAHGLGMEPEDIVGKSDFELYPQELAERYRVDDRAVMASGEARDIEEPYEVGGQRFWVHTVKTPIRDTTGNVTGILGIFWDITEQKNAAQELERSQAGLSEAQRIAHLGNWELNLTNNELIWSDEIYRIFEIDRAKFGASYEAFLDAIHPDDRDMVNKAYTESVKYKLPYNIVHRLLMPDGRIKYVNEKCETYYGEDGKPTNSFGTVHDITEIRQAEEKIHKLNQELERRVTKRTAELEDANKELEAFSFSVSHDLRAPLRAIDGFSHILLEEYAETLDDEGKRLLSVVRDNTVRMGQLIDDILKFSRAGRLEINFSQIDMEEMAHDVFNELSLSIDASGLQFEIESLPQARGDSAMIRQVLVNLFSNAIKFSSTQETPRIQVGATITENEIIYFVKDNGVGYDMQYMDKLFGVFQRLHDTAEFEGTGIGLAIVKRIITRHGGRVWAEGKVDEGATFYFSLPQSETEESDHAD